MKKKVVVILVSFWLFLCLLYFFLTASGILHEKTYDDAYFQIETVMSDIDYDQDGIDDYTDIVEGALEAGRKKPKYHSAYYDGGYPPEDEGVCTDVVWRALQNAGYDLKALVDDDIQNNRNAYTRIEIPDSNIDFRRVYNLHVFFERNTLSLTTDITKIEEFQAGDILIFENDKHIGIVSNKRNKKGIPYLIHHTGTLSNQLNYLEEDILASYKIIGHYRFQLKNK